MPITSRKITAFAKKVADFPDRPGGTITAAEIKAQFDSSPEELRVAHNGAMDDLTSTTAGASGAHNVGSAAISGLTGATVYEQLTGLKGFADSATAHAALTTSAHGGIAPSSHVGATGSAHGVATSGVNGFMSSTDKSKLDAIASGAEVNQNAFSKISVSGQSNVDADTKTDTLTLAAGTGIALTTDPATDTVMITAQGDQAPGAHASTHITGGADVIANAVANGNAGMMSGADKAKLDILVRTATLVVAASNSFAAGKAAADYVCTGVNDHTTINSAITALGATGGKVVLLEGQFAIAASINLPSNVSLEGQGSGTVMQIPNANNTTFNVIQNSDSVNGNTGLGIYNLKIDGNKASNTAGTQQGIFLSKVTYSTIQNVTVVNMRNNGISLSGSTNSSFNNMIRGNTVQGNGTNGIVLNPSFNISITENTVQGNSSNGISLVSGSNNNMVSGNIVQDNAQIGIQVQSSNYNVVLGNTIRGISTSFEGIGLSSASNNTINGNTIQGASSGFYSSSSNNNVIAGNTMQGNRICGILMQSSSNNVVLGNTCFENSQATDNTNDNIKLNGTSNTNNIQGNTCRQGVLTNKPRYGIRVDAATCTGNMITNNDLTTGGATGAFSDAGTGTVTTAGNKVA